MTGSVVSVIACGFFAVFGVLVPTILITLGSDAVEPTSAPPTYLRTVGPLARAALLANNWPNVGGTATVGKPTKFTPVVVQG